jgi:hypothetical protein
MTSPEARGDLPSFSAVINSLGACGDLPRSAWITSLGARGSPSERVDLLPWSAWSTVWIASLGARGSPSLSAWMVALGSRGSPPFERMDGASERVDVPWVILMGSPSITARLPGVVAQRVHAAGAHASQTSTKRAGDSAQAPRKGAQRPACVHLCAWPKALAPLGTRALLQRF